MNRFPKKELNAEFLKQVKRALKDSSRKWASSSQSFGFAIDNDLFFVLKLQQSTSPTKAGFRAITGVGSKSLTDVMRVKPCKLPDVHLAHYYVPSRQPEGFDSAGESWMIVTRSEHIPMQVQGLVSYLENETCAAINEHWNNVLFKERMRTHGNPYEFQLLSQMPANVGASLLSDA